MNKVCTLRLDHDPIESCYGDADIMPLSIAYCLTSTILKEYDEVNSFIYDPLLTLEFVIINKKIIESSKLTW